MLLAIALGVVLGLGAAALRRSGWSAPLSIAVFVLGALVFLALVDDDEVWVLAGAMLVASGLVDLVDGGRDPRVSERVARVVAAVLVVVGAALIALG